MGDEIDIKGLDKAVVLQALWNGSHAIGMSWLDKKGSVSLEDCQTHLNQSTDVDYFAGHIIKCKLGGDSFDPWLYDRDNGPGAAAHAIDAIR